MVVFGVIILVVLVVIGILIWRKTKSASLRISTLTHDKVASNTAVIVENDLYGLVLSCLATIV